MTWQTITTADVGVAWLAGMQLSQCWKCKKDFQAKAMIIRNGPSQWKLQNLANATQGQGYPNWVLSHVEATSFFYPRMPGALTAWQAVPFKTKTPQEGFTMANGHGYLANHCNHCGMVQRDEKLFGPGGPFFNITASNLVIQSGLFCSSQGGAQPVTFNACLAKGF